MSDKTLGILTYIDDTPEMLEDFSWLYKSWIHSGNWRTSDLILVCNPRVIDKLPTEAGIVKIPIEPLARPGSKWEGYPYINSIGCLVGPHVTALVPRYTHFLRTDADVFLTHNLVNFRPNVAVHGRGHYAELPEVRARIVAFAEGHGMQHHGFFNCGSSLLASSALVAEFLESQYNVATALLDEEFADDPGEWPGWCRNVLTMYAAEMVANHSAELLLRLGYLNMLDYETVLWSRIDEGFVVHIHALHTAEAHWTKLAHRAGAYRDYDLSSLDRGVVKDYCHWIAVTPLEEIKREAGYAPPREARVSFRFGRWLGA